MYDFSEYINQHKDGSLKRLAKKLNKGEPNGPLRIEDQVWYREYIQHFLVIPRYQRPECCEDDFDWDLLGRLTAASYSSKLTLVHVDDDTPPIMRIEVCNENDTVTKEMHELWGFQIVRLYEIYTEENIRVADLLLTDKSEVKRIQEQRAERILRHNRRVTSLISRLASGEEDLHEAGRIAQASNLLQHCRCAGDIAQARRLVRSKPTLEGF